MKKIIVLNIVGFQLLYLGVIMKKQRKHLQKVNDVHNKMDIIKPSLIATSDEFRDNEELFDYCVNRFTNKHTDYIYKESTEKVMDLFDVYMLCEFDDIKRTFMRI